MESLLFCLIKRTKNQGFGMVVKAQFSVFIEDFRSERFILFTPEFADFVADLLRSYRQTSSVSVRKQNPTIPRPEVDCELGVRIYK